MKKHFRILATLPVILALAHTASASTVLYDNGLIYGSFTSPRIDTIHQVSDSFTLGAAATVTGANFGVWTEPAITVNSVRWSISSGALDTGTVFGSGTAAVSNTLFRTGASRFYDVNAASLSLPPCT